MTGWKFSCEQKDEIPLPPKYTFPQAFNYLNPAGNSFYCLEAPNHDYIQCGGSKERCTIEIRRHQNGSQTHCVVGRKEGSDEPATVQMTDGTVSVLEREVFTSWDAIKLFQAFFDGQALPEHLSLREVEL